MRLFPDKQGYSISVHVCVHVISVSCRYFFKGGGAKLCLENFAGTVVHVFCASVPSRGVWGHASPTYLDPPRALLVHFLTTMHETVLLSRSAN